MPIFEKSNREAAVTPVKAPTNYMFLDGLRGIGSIVVVLSHFSLIFFPNANAPDERMPHNHPAWLKSLR